MTVLQGVQSQIAFFHYSLLAFIALLAVQSPEQTRIHDAILVIDTSNNVSYNQVHWLVRMPYLSIKASVTAISNELFNQ